VTALAGLVDNGQVWIGAGCFRLGGEAQHRSPASFRDRQRWCSMPKEAGGGYPDSSAGGVRMTVAQTNFHRGGIIQKNI
jgi:hypothetical protein